MILVKPGQRGAAVAVLQQRLSEAGLLPDGAADEVKMSTYGPVTQGAIRTFQAKHGLDVDSIVGQLTWRALSLGVEQSKEPIPGVDVTSSGTFPAQVLVIADKEWRDGVIESPVGSNRGPRVDQYVVGNDGATYLLGAPWCGRFAKWCVDEAARVLGCTSPIIDYGDLASAFKWREKANSHGKLVDEPRAGRVGLILIPPAATGAEPHGHVVLIATVDGNRLSTREGNSGNRVAARWRRASEFTGGFVDLA